MPTKISLPIKLKTAHVFGDLARVPAASASRPPASRDRRAMFPRLNHGCIESAKMLKYKCHAWFNLAMHELHPTKATTRPLVNPPCMRSCSTSSSPPSTLRSPKGLATHHRDRTTSTGTAVLYYITKHYVSLKVHSSTNTSTAAKI